MNEKYTAIYVRRSVGDKDNKSLSIPAQKAECVRFLGEGAVYKIYEEEKSAKDIMHRPVFKSMMNDARDGLISRIVVKKYDRFSRNMRDYLNISDELDKMGVPIVSLCEPFNTETKEGRMMRNNLLNFAEFERETIASRVKDSYDTKAAETGFYQGGVVYFGYNTTRQVVNGKKGSVLVPSESGITVTEMFRMYARPETSLRDVCFHIRDDNFPITAPERDKVVSRVIDAPYLSSILKNPLYVRADRNVYEYLLAHNYRILDDIDAFDGIHGLFWHNYRSKTDRYVKIGYHEGLIDAETWLAVQDKFSHHRIPQRKGSNLRSFCSGLVRCPHCGKSINVDYSINPKSGNSWRYLRCRGYNSVKGCDVNGLSIRVTDVEDIVYKAMKEHIADFEIRSTNNVKPSSEGEKIRSEILKIESESSKLIERLADADDILFNYIQDRITVLHKSKNELEKKLLTVERRVKKVDTKPLIDPLNRWEQLDVNEQNKIARLMIDTILVSDDEGVEIHFSF